MPLTGSNGERLLQTTDKVQDVRMDGIDFIPSSLNNDGYNQRDLKKANRKMRDSILFCLPSLWHSIAEAI